MCEDRSIWEIEKGRSKCGLTFDKIWLDGDIILAGERGRVKEKRKRKRKVRIWEIEKGRSKCCLTFDKIWLDGDIVLAVERGRVKEKRKRKRKRKVRINPKEMFDILNID